MTQILHPVWIFAHQCQAWDNKGINEDRMIQVNERYQSKAPSRQHGAMRTDKISKTTMNACHQTTINERLERRNENKTSQDGESETTYSHGTSVDCWENTEVGWRCGRRQKVGITY